MIRSICGWAGLLLALLASATTVAAQVPGFPAYGPGPQGPPPPGFPGGGAGQISGTGPGSSGFGMPLSGSNGAAGTPTNQPAATAPGEVAVELFEPGKLVAQVGDQPILYGEILGDLNQIVNREMPDASDFIKDSRRRALFSQLLPKMVEQKMVYVDFTHSIPDADKRIPEITEKLDANFYNSEIPKLMERLGASDQLQLEEMMRESGTSLRNVKKAWIESQIVGFYLSSKFEEEREVTHLDMIDYYREHLTEFSFPARVRWEEMLVKIDNQTPEEIARRTIEDMGNEVVFGAPLAAVAKRRSQGSTAADGGMHDWTNEGTLKDKELERVLFTMQLDYLSDVIRSEDGFRIVRVIGREPGGHRQFRDVQGEIKEAIKLERRKEKVQKYLEELRANVPVWSILDGTTSEPTGELPATAERPTTTRSR